VLFVDLISVFLDVFRGLWKFFLKQGHYGPLLLLLLQTSGHLVLLPNERGNITKSVCLSPFKLCVDCSNWFLRQQEFAASHTTISALVIWRTKGRFDVKRHQFDVVYNWTRYNENKINNSKCMPFLRRKPNGIEMSRWSTDQFIDRFYLFLPLVSNVLVRNVKILQRLLLDIFRVTSK
jgi:hypothetical protein